MAKEFEGLDETEIEEEINSGGDAGSEANNESGTVEIESPSFFTSYRRKKRPTATNNITRAGRESIGYQLTKYLATEFDEFVNPFSFWSSHEANPKYPELSKLARQVLIVPATSAPVERLFSHGGIITRPHRACLSDKNLSNIIFLKCNRLR